MFYCGSDFFCFIYYTLVDQTGDLDFSGYYESNWNYYGTDRIYSEVNSFSACGQLKFEIFEEDFDHFSATIDDETIPMVNFRGHAANTLSFVQDIQINIGWVDYSDAESLSYTVNVKNINCNEFISP